MCRDLDLCVVSQYRMSSQAVCLYVVCRSMMGFYKTIFLYYNILTHSLSLCIRICVYVSVCVFCSSCRSSSSFGKKQY